MAIKRNIGTVLSLICAMVSLILACPAQADWIRCERMFVSPSPRNFTVEQVLLSLNRMSGYGENNLRFTSQLQYDSFVNALVTNLDFKTQVAQILMRDVANYVKRDDIMALSIRHLGLEITTDPRLAFGLKPMLRAVLTRNAVNIVDIRVLNQIFDRQQNFLVTFDVTHVEATSGQTTLSRYVVRSDIHSGRVEQISKLVSDGSSEEIFRNEEPRTRYYFSLEAAPKRPIERLAP